MSEAKNPKETPNESTPESSTNSEAPVRLNFVEQAITEDLQKGRFDRVHTRFPPEPNGYLHIGHAKSICLNFGLKEKFNGKCNLRMDDTNPTKEETEYVESIMEDVRWLGFEWDGMFYASDYFEQLYEWAIKLIKEGNAYVDEQTPEDIRKGRGNLTSPGTHSPYRDRPPEENLDLFERMKNGEFPDGSKVLRARIDMASPNMNLRDPVLYRILHAEHHRTGNKWCIYPMYDYAHGQSDSIEGITHSICTLEFENHRPLYEWFLEAIDIYKPRQIEFARLNVTYMVMSKRKLLELVKSGAVSGWDDPRMPTISGMRRRGYTPEALRAFCEDIGVAKFNGVIEFQKLEFFIRQDLNKRALRAFAVMNPLKVVITNFPEGEVKELEGVNNPEDESVGKRIIPFSRELYIERDDFREDPPKKYFRLAPGKEVRLRWAYFIKCEEVIKDDDGNIIELRCTYDPETLGGKAPDGRKVKGTIHWVSANHALDAEVRLYETLLATATPDEGLDEDGDWKDNLNPDSLTILKNCKVEPSLLGADPGNQYQFERVGYFCVDPDSTHEQLVFNRTVTLNDSWAKIEKKETKR